MCQISAVLKQDGQQEKIMENVTTLEVTPEGIVLSTLFEEPRLIHSTRIEKIDFLGGCVTLVPHSKGNCNDRG
jgi:predicted RNA-binding protein